MNDKDSVFGATPEGLDRLIAGALTHVEPEEPVQPYVTLETWTERPGGQIGPYALLSTLGEGGMGIVYLAEQTQPLRRRVALKVIKPGMDTKQVIARFEAERQALAVLDHAKIARVFHAGTTAGGRPYFVMELVTGLAITQYCDEHRLSIAERLALFLQVCEAVQHAHQKGIIHRDIKPSNLLVSRQDGHAVPKIIDFGIAKAVIQPLTERTLYTEQGQFVGTPEYMSPEQAEPTVQGIDTRTDIYSLGVVLYELLSGMLPFDTETLRQGDAEHIRRIIREEDPKTPSTRLNKVSGDTSTAVAALRRTDMRSLGRALHGDLDWITLKAMDKEPNRRYATAHALAEDIQRHLNHEPVTAGSPGVIYRTQKSLRRHRRKLMAVFSFAILVTGLAISLAILQTGLDESRNAEIIRHENTLSQAMALGDRGEYPEALSTVETILNSVHLGSRARLLHARLRMLSLQSAAEVIMANDARWVQVINELKGLLQEPDEVAGQAHFLLATIYYESDPEAPTSTRDYNTQWAYHKHKADELLPETADSYLLRAISAATVPQTLAFIEKTLELDPRHFESIKTRAYIHHACSNYRQMALDTTRMKTIKPDDPQSYSLSAIAQRGLGWFAEALTDHNRAIALSPDDPVLIEERYQTHMRRGDFHRALADAQACTGLEPSVHLYHMRVLYAYTALGRFDEAKRSYDHLTATYDFDRNEYADRSTRHVFAMLAAGMAWHGSGSVPRDKTFLVMLQADAYYRHLSEKAKRVVVHGSNPSFSPDGSQFVYSLGIPRSTGIAIYDLDTQQSQLITIPGDQAAWSPDGRFIAYTRSRGTLPFSVLSRQAPFKGFSEPGRGAKAEIWLIKADGTENPHYLARGNWPAWSRDSQRVYYRSPADKMLYSIGVNDRETKPFPIHRGAAAVSPDEKYVVTWSKETMQVVDRASGSVIARHDDIPPRQCGWSPDGRSVLLTGWEDTGGMWLYDLETQSLSGILKAKVMDCPRQGLEFEGFSFSSHPRRPALAFTVRGQVTLFEEDIWLAPMSSLDPRIELPDPGQTPAAHHREVIREYSAAIEMDPEEPRNYLLRAERHLKLQEIEQVLSDIEGFAYVEQQTDIWKNDKPIRKKMRGLVAKAIGPREDTIGQTFPGTALAWAYFYQGALAQGDLVDIDTDYERALERYQAAIDMNPELAVAYNGLAALQATCLEPQWHAAEPAIRNAARACALTDWTNLSYIETYAAAHARAGDFNAAVKWQKEVFTQLGPNGNKGLKAQIQAKLELYQQKKAYQQQYLWPDRLIAGWKFHLDDTQQVRDHSGHDLHGRFRGDARIVSDPDRGAVLSLDGKGDFVDCGKDVRFNLTDTISICAWIKPRILNRKHQSLISNGDRGWILNRQAYGNGMQIAGYGVASSVNPGSYWGHLPSQAEVTDGQWHHIVGVYDGAHLMMYVDGKLDVKAQASGRIRANDWPVFIGESSEQVNREWNGLIDDVRIYSYALTPQEIKAIYSE